MSYFRELPDLEYQSNLLHKVSSQEYIRVKNLFRRVKLQDYVQDNVTLFQKYVILEGQRPDTVAEAFYGSADLDWIVILTAEISNIRDQWPLSNYDLEDYNKIRTPAVFYCQTGKRSLGLVSRILAEDPEAEVYSLKGGVKAFFNQN